MEPTTTPREASTEAATNWSAGKTAAIPVSAASKAAIAGTAVKASAVRGSIPSAPVKAAPIETASIETVIPRTGADKDAPREPRGPVVAVRRTRIGIVTVIAIGTCRRGSDVSRTNPNSYHNSSAGESRGQNQHTQQSEIS